MVGNIAFGINFRLFLLFNFIAFIDFCLIFFNQFQDEEKHRVVYDKECKKLKDFTKKGAESSKIEVVSISVGRLLLRINVSVTSIDAISRRIDKLRDEKLLPQLSELIQGYVIITFLDHFNVEFSIIDQGLDLA